jgi:hypothetical protein
MTEFLKSWFLFHGRIANAHLARPVRQPLQFLHGKADCLPKAARARPVAVGPAGSIVEGLPKNSRPTTPGLALIS